MTPSTRTPIAVDAVARSASEAADIVDIAGGYFAEKRADGFAIRHERGGLHMALPPEIAMVNAIGWPDVTGGPLWWADSIGLDKVRDAMLRYAAIAGAEYWTPAPLIEQLVAAGKGFYNV